MLKSRCDAARVDVIVEVSLQKNSTAHGITASYGKFLREALT